MRYLKFLLLLSFFLLQYGTTYAWIFPEHRDIMRAGIEKLPSEKRQQLEALWKLARTGYENRLSPSVIFEGTVTSKSPIDLASWPAISGDHSVSGKDMLNIVLNSDWIDNVCEIAYELKLDLAAADSREIGRAHV